MNAKYLHRISEAVLEQKLDSSGAVLIEGPKWCGKTSTGAYFARSILYVQDPDKRQMYKQMADTQPSLLLQGDTPRLLDEWQTIPLLWDAVRFAVDRRQEVNQFILTGSATPLPDSERSEIEHSGTGRIARIRMHTMSLWESGDSGGEVSLQALFDHTQPDLMAESRQTIEDLAFLLCRGGWPATVQMNKRSATEMAYNYVEEIIQQDIHRVDNTEKNPDRVRNVMRSYARNIATMTAASTIMKDVSANDMTITDKTLSNYLTALRRMFVVEDVKAWMPSLRSKTAIRTSDKRHFADPSIATAVLELTPKSLLQDFNLFGYLFESMCVRDLRVYCQSIRGEVFHYHDYNNLEADIILRLRDGRWAAIEVKTGQKEIELAAQHLVKLTQVVDTSKVGEPAFLMVLTGGQYAFRRKDGVWVVPLACLKN